MAETARRPTVLSEAELAAFRERGYVRVEGAFSADAALALQDEVWTELRQDFGIERERRETWTQPRHGARRTKESPSNGAVVTERFTGAISDLLGTDDWPRPRTWGGFLVTFPHGADEPWELPTEIWHWDGSPTARGLLIFSFYAEVPPRQGGTLIVEGSHRLVDAYYGSLEPEVLAEPHKAHRRRFSTWDPWLAALTGRAKPPVEDRVATFMERSTPVRGVPCRVVELTGSPGDAVFCNLGLVHASSPNRAELPRIMRVKFLFLER